MVSSNFLEGLELGLETGRSANPSVAAVVMLYIDSLPSLTAQERSSPNPWPLFREDKRFSKLHKFLGKILCVLATSAAVERVFSHGGLFMRPHRLPMND